MQLPPVEKPTCVAFEEYKEVSETVSLGLLEYGATWIASKLSVAYGALGAEANELSN